MKYYIQWQEEADQDLLNLPEKIALAIHKKVETYLAQNPRQLGIALTGKFSGFYRYRIGDYRVIYKIYEKEICIHVIRVGHRKNIYEN